MKMKKKTKLKIPKEFRQHSHLQVNAFEKILSALVLELKIEIYFQIYT